MEAVAQFSVQFYSTLQPVVIANLSHMVQITTHEHNRIIKIKQMMVYKTAIEGIPICCV